MRPIVEDFELFPIVRVDRFRSEAPEPLGSQPKFWFREGTKRILFKAEERGTGEDWAEVVACHLCGLLGVPRVIYQFAEEWNHGAYVRPGVVCQNMAEPPTSLVLGNELLLGRDSSYPIESRRRVRQHTIAAVAEVVGELQPPHAEWLTDAPAETRSAHGIFVGYLMLDAWISNQDRHHENWGALRDDVLRLAPTFDHGASMARNISDLERRERLTSQDHHRTTAAFAKRARSALFESQTATRSLATLDAFVQYAEYSPQSAAAWLSRLAELTKNEIEATLAQVSNSRMSSVCKEFTLELLWCNRTRLLETRIS